jgi:membrane protein implicated in regulation of membrane protease activity
MNWLSENYKWVFDGIGAAVLVGLIAWLWRRFFKEPAAENATVNVRDSQVRGSPIASGSQVTQNIH